MKPENREKRARQIEAAAYDLLDSKGFAGLSMQAIAKAAHASNETLYRWYGDKTGLFEALIRGNSAIVEAAIDAAGSDRPLDNLATIGPGLLTMLLGERAVALNRAAAADDSGTLGRALAREGRNTIAPRIVAIMDLAARTGALSGGTPQEMAETYFALLIGDLQVRRVTGALPAPHEDYIRKRADQALDHLQRIFPAGDLDATRQSEYL